MGVVYGRVEKIDEQGMYKINDREIRFEKTLLTKIVRLAWLTQPLRILWYSSIGVGE